MADRKLFSVSVVTPDGPAYEGDAQMIIVPGAAGEIGILPGHTPLLTTLRIGIMRYRNGGTTHRLVLRWGFAEVLPDRVIVLAETARLPEEIDAAQAEADRAAAEREMLDLSSNDPEFAVVEARLEESIVAISISREH